MGYWPGITEAQIESQPGFYNDDNAWGNWMAERYNEPRILEAINALGANAILSHITDGVNETDVDWVSPQQLLDAALCLREAVKKEQPETAIIFESYSRNANNSDPVDQEFMQDLDDIVAIAKWAEFLGAEKMTLEVNW